jgi:RLL motif-containing protein 1
MVLGARTRALAVEALGYAKGAPPLELADVSFREFVVWLEDTKIRATPLDSRGPLRAVAAADWPSAFGALARETGYELDATSPAETTRVFDHLLEQAVALDYRDNADDLGGVVKDLKNAAIGASAPRAKRQRIAPASAEDRPRMEGMDHPELRAKLDQLARALEVDAAAVMAASGGDAGGGVEALVDACARAVERFVAPFWSRVEAVERAKTTKPGDGDAKDAAPSPSPSPSPSWNLVPADFPPGMELGGEAGASETVRAAVAVLRVLHVNDLRVLQSAVDALLVQMQEYTSDPRTDAKLGRVGSG